jgi:nitroimidazol reductase NimA-like FMN-containing flavoprotein (pyridoxamine 5'-phosphate oxidase superfamily)
MHRAEYEITAEVELLDLLLRGKFVTIAMYDKPYPYLVTLSYGFDPVTRCLYLHTARVGHKLELLSVNQAVCGTVVHDLGYQTGKCRHCYASVIVYGRLRRVEDGEERRRGMRVLLQQLEGDSEAGWRRFKLDTEKPWETVQILALDVARMTGRRGS